MAGVGDNMVFCSNCGTENDDNASFCKECGCSFSSNESHVEENIEYIDVLRDFIMIKDESGERISKAKVIGLLVLLFYVVYGISVVRWHIPTFWMFAFFLLFFYLGGLFYYFLIRGLGYILREHVFN